MSLPWDFYTNNKKFIDKYETKLVSFASKEKAKMDSDKKIKLLKKMIEYYYNMKEVFFNKGSYFEEYFLQTWEHCSNSKQTDFKYIEKYEKKLERLEKKKKSAKT